MYREDRVDEADHPVLSQYDKLNAAFGGDN
jgi:hypothetical protein